MLSSKNFSNSSLFSKIFSFLNISELFVLSISLINIWYTSYVSLFLIELLFKTSLPFSTVFSPITSSKIISSNNSFVFSTRSWVYSLIFFKFSKKFWSMPNSLKGIISLVKTSQNYSKIVSFVIKFTISIFIELIYISILSFSILTIQFKSIITELSSIFSALLIISLSFSFSLYIPKIFFFKMRFSN